MLVSDFRFQVGKVQELQSVGVGADQVCNLHRASGVVGSIRIRREENTVHTLGDGTLSRGRRSTMCARGLRGSWCLEHFAQHGHAAAAAPQQPAACATRINHVLQMPWGRRNTRVQHCTRRIPGARGNGAHNAYVSRWVSSQWKCLARHAALAAARGLYTAGQARGRSRCRSAKIIPAPFYSAPDNPPLLVLSRLLQERSKLPAAMLSPLGMMSLAQNSTRKCHTPPGNVRQPRGPSLVHSE